MHESIEIIDKPNGSIHGRRIGGNPGNLAVSPGSMDGESGDNIRSRSWFGDSMLKKNNGCRISRPDDRKFSRQC